MKTNLIFKRTNQGKVEMVMIPVELPQLNEGEGWALASCCDTFDVLEKPTIEQVQKQLEDYLPPAIKEAPYQSKVKGDVSKQDDSVIQNVPSSPESPVKPIPAGGKYDSGVQGTARLVRYKNTIRITYRKGKTTYNRNDPNSICIDDCTKQQFFNEVKRERGSGVLVWELTSADSSYSYWNKYIDTEYERGRTEYNKKLDQ